LCRNRYTDGCSDLGGRLWEIVSIEEGKEFNITFSPNLQEIYFTRRTPGGRDNRLWYSRLENGRLTTPELAPFAYDCFETDACFTPA
jgi:hypothetical protein